MIANSSVFDSSSAVFCLGRQCHFLCKNSFQARSLLFQDGVDDDISIRLISLTILVLSAASLLFVEVLHHSPQRYCTTWSFNQMMIDSS